MSDLSAEARRLLDAAGAPAPDPAARLRMKHAVLAAVVAPGAAAAAASAGAKPVGALLSGLLGKVLAGTAAVAVGAGGAWSAAQVRTWGEQRRAAAAATGEARRADVAPAASPDAVATPQPRTTGLPPPGDADAAPAVPGGEGASSALAGHAPAGERGQDLSPEPDPRTVLARRDPPPAAPGPAGSKELRGAVAREGGDGVPGAATASAPRAVLANRTPGEGPLRAALSPASAATGRGGAGEPAGGTPERAALSPALAALGREAPAGGTPERAAFSPAPAVPGREEPAAGSPARAALSPTSAAGREGAGAAGGAPAPAVPGREGAGELANGSPERAALAAPGRGGAGAAGGAPAPGRESAGAPAGGAPLRAAPATPGRESAGAAAGGAPAPAAPGREGAGAPARGTASPAVVAVLASATAAPGPQGDQGAASPANAGRLGTGGFDDTRALEPAAGLADTSGPGVRDELEVLGRAKAQHDASQWPGALDTLDAYEARFPSGRLRTEASALRVLVLCGLRRTADARALAAQLLETEPGSPAVRRLAGTCAGR